MYHDILKKEVCYMNTNEVICKAENVIMHTYGRYKLVFDHGDGMYLYDIEQKKYLDFAAGIGVFALGYNNKEYNEALISQINKITHISNYYYSVPMTEAAEKFVSASGMDRVFFTNSGTEAVEGAVKLARKYYFNKTGIADSEIIAMQKSFHGRTMGALSVTGTKSYRDPFEPLIGNVKFAEFNDIESVKKCITKKTCAIIMETVQGEGGIHPATREFLSAVRALCDENDILLILDEVQCGMGRSGKFFAYQTYGITPDIMTSAKGLGNGVPVGAFGAKERVASAFRPGDHGSTYGGNPFVCAAVSRVFDLFNEKNILENVNTVGDYLYTALNDFAARHKDIVTDHRGIKMMQGLEFNTDVHEIVQRGMDNGLVTIAAGKNVIRFLPPLIAEKRHVDECIEKLECAVK